MIPLMGQALPRQDDALADRCAVAVILARARGANFPRKGSKSFTQYFSERPEMTTQLRGLKKAMTTELKQKETITMKPKLTKTIMSSLAFTCALGCLVAAMALGTSNTARATERFPQSCSAHTLNGLYLLTFDGYQNVGGNLLPKAIMQGTRFNGDGTLVNEFGTVNIGGFIIIDATGGVGTYTVAPDCTGTIFNYRRPKLQHVRQAGRTAALDHADCGRCWQRRGTRRRNRDAAAIVKVSRLRRRDSSCHRLQGLARSMRAKPVCWQANMRGSNQTYAYSPLAVFCVYEPSIQIPVGCAKSPHEHCVFLFSRTPIIVCLRVWPR